MFHKGSHGNCAYMIIIGSVAFYDVFKPKSKIDM